MRYASMNIHNIICVFYDYFILWLICATYIYIIYYIYAFWNEMMIFENQSDKLIFMHVQFLHLLIGLQSCTSSQIVSFLLCDKFTMILLRPHKHSFPVLVG